MADQKPYLNWNKGERGDLGQRGRIRPERDKDRNIMFTRFIFPIVVLDVGLICIQIRSASALFADGYEVHETTLETNFPQVGENYFTHHFHLCGNHTSVCHLPAIVFQFCCFRSSSGNSTGLCPDKELPQESLAFYFHRQRRLQSLQFEN